MTANAVKRALQAYARPQKAKVAEWFFKTEKGNYGEGDVFIGITVPEQRIVAKQFLALPLPEIKTLLQSKIHEHRLTALCILVYRFQKADTAERKQIARFYIANRARVNNWDLVDASAAQILGVSLLKKDRKILYRFARSKNLWERRIAIVATWAFIRANDHKDTLAISEMLLNDKEDLIHKATGWMLREVGKRSEKALVTFLDKNVRKMPRTALRYAIEKFAEKKRKEYLAIRP